MYLTKVIFLHFFLSSKANANIFKFFVPRLKMGSRVKKVKKNIKIEIIIFSLIIRMKKVF